MRVNADGTVDFASCVAVERVTGAEASTASRTGFFGEIDESTQIELPLIGSVNSLDEGEVISFRGVPDDWDRLDVWIEGTSLSIGKPFERDRVVIGDWYWDDNPSLFSDFVPGQRCDLND